MEKLDLRKQHKALYNPPSKNFVIVDVPPLNCLMIDGTGDPNTSPAFVHAVQALYSVSYTLKFSIKKAGGPEYSVMPLEALWWVPDMSTFLSASKDEWLWTAFIVQPEFVTVADIEDAKRAVAKKKPDLDLSGLRLETFTEGQSVQILYFGAYADEGPTIARLHTEYLPAHGLRPRGKHHEIYLGDPQRTAPEKLKTIIRQPVERAAQG